MRMLCFSHLRLILPKIYVQLKWVAGIVLVPILLYPSCRAQMRREPIIPAAQTPGAGAAPAPQFTYGGLSDGPISPGETVHINIFHVPELSMVTRVSSSGDIAFPFLGVFRIGGLTSVEAGDRLAKQLKERSLVVDPQVMVTVDSTSTGITVLGEVHSPGIFPPPGKHLLSDLLAAAGGVTANTGRVIEISNNSAPANKLYIPWDPTMHNTSSYDQPVHPGDRIIVRACGIAYVGGKVAKPGAYSLCGSPQMTLAEVLALAGGIQPLSASNHTMLVRTHSDGTRTEMELDAHKILVSRAADLTIQEDDIIYVPASSAKNFAKSAMEFSLSLVSPLLYFYR